MRSTVSASALLLAMYGASLVSAPVAFAAATEPADPRLREVTYDPLAVVTVPVKRGIVTLVVLGADESITDVAAGRGRVGPVVVLALFDAARVGLTDGGDEAEHGFLRRHIDLEPQRAIGGAVDGPVP